MRIAFSCSAAFLAVCLLAPAASPASDPTPDWVRQAAAQTVPSYSAKVNSVVLLSEEMVTVDPDGRRVMRERGAVKVLQQSSDALRVFRTYDTKGGRIRDFQGWLLPASGKTIEYGKNRLIDQAISAQDVYGETREKVLDFGSNAPGSIMAWEITEEEKTVFTQDGYAFQGRRPVLVSRFVLNLPPSWEARGIVFNHEKFDPQVAGSTFTWELRDLPFYEREEFSPAPSALLPRLMVSYFPPSDNQAGLVGMKDWAAVSKWLSPMVDPAASVTASIRAKAAELTANAPNEIDKIRAIGKFVQQTTYVEISLNVTRGGGYTPHRAEESLAKNYGDCKDKATLMRALLKAVNIDSYLTTITADERSYVRPEWASPMQFNHAIIAVRVSEGVNLPTVLLHDSLGRLLLFDPTDPITPLGDLPHDEQGSYALIVAGAQGALLKMPLLPPSASRVESSVTASVDAAGKVIAQVQRQYFGQSGIPIRAVEKMRGSDELQKRFERLFANSITGSSLSRVATQISDNSGGSTDDNHVTVSVDVTAEHFGQSMQNKLLILRPGAFSSAREYMFTSRKRSAPVKLDANMRRDSIRVKLPEGFGLDEVPTPVKLDSPYGSLETNWVVKDGEVLMETTLEVRETVAPPSEFAQIRDFFDKVAGAQAAALVLVKQ